MFLVTNRLQRYSFTSPIPQRGRVKWIEVKKWDSLGVMANLSNRVKFVAADGFGAPGVVVIFANSPEMQSGKPFAALGMQIAAGVPLQCDEGPEYRSFRLGLFGLDKLYDVDASVARLERALDQVLAA